MNYWLEALDEGALAYRIDDGELLPLAHAHPSLGMLLFELLDREMTATHDLMEDLMLYGVKDRLAHVLARLALVDPQRVVRLTHHELAGLMGTSRENVTKALRRLQALGHVAAHPRRRHILVHDPEELLSLQTKMP